MQLFIYTQEDSVPQARLLTQSEFESAYPGATVLKIIAIEDGTAPTAGLIKALALLSDVSGAFGIQDALEEFAAKIWSAAKEA